MSAHRGSNDFARANALEELKIADPGAGGTFDLQGNWWSRVTLTAAGTYTLPSADIGTTLVVAVDDTSAIVIADGGGTIASFTGTTSGSGCICTSLGTNSWGAQLFGDATAEAAAIAIADSGALTTATNVETGLQQALKNSQILRVDLTSLLDADGDPLAKFADNASPNPGFNLADSEAFGIRWNNNGTQGQPVIGSVLLPTGLNDGSAVTMNIIASKTGATIGDAVTFTVTAYAQVVGLLHDDEANLGAVSSAMTGNATAKTVQHETLLITNSVGIDTGPSLSPTPLFFTITPTTGTLGTDDVIIEGISFSITGLT